ncbi:hypothetical protein B0T20DRAFT_393978 [Sordaria brevicollis]|uniref:Uncharacterized protein n=1 Tax=Sordaria brevicollis TaxID=83679 RepID=A0AAE0PBY9_SORBR|nr:hypothetical protein B0T20DRAFT_393978 [Sordaria brevicollis]
MHVTVLLPLSMVVRGWKARVCQYDKVLQTDFCQDGIGGLIGHARLGGLRMTKELGQAVWKYKRGSRETNLAREHPKAHVSLDHYSSCDDRKHTTKVSDSNNRVRHGASMPRKSTISRQERNQGLESLMEKRIPNADDHRQRIPR